MMLDGWFCEPGMEWDDHEKMCVVFSTTCPNPPQTTTGLPDDPTTALPMEESKDWGIWDGFPPL